MPWYSICAAGFFPAGPNHTSWPPTLFVYMLSNFFFSGQMFPIDMLPGVWGTLVRIIPLQYLAYFPAAVFLGKVQGADLAWGLLIQLGWVLFFIVVCRLAFYLGVRRYSGFGG